MTLFHFNSVQITSFKAINLKVSFHCSSSFYDNYYSSTYDDFFNMFIIRKSKINPCNKIISQFPTLALFELLTVNGSTVTVVEPLLP